MRQKWERAATDTSDANKLANELDIGKLLSHVLVARGYSNAKSANAFLQPDFFNDWGEGRLIPGMTLAAKVVADAIRSRSHILIFGDYDVDGLTATAILIRFLDSCGIKAVPVIPHRLDEGYGLTDASLARVLEIAPDLVVTVDSGITSVNEVARLMEHGIKVVITDHHEPADIIPKATAVTNPKLNSDSDDGILAGVSVCLKLVELLMRELELPATWSEYADFAALGTVADVMPLTGKNRSLVQYGLNLMNTRPRAGLAELFKLSGNATNLCASDLSFGAIPMLNAAGRMDDPMLALRLLLTNDKAEAAILAAKLNELNQLRREKEGELTKLALDSIADMSSEQKVIVTGGAGWHDGVKGIVASRLARQTGLPAIVYSIEDGLAIGSGRSVGVINLFNVVQQTADMLVRFGGHAGAIGVSLAENDIPKFKQRLADIILELPEEDFFSPLNIDCRVDCSELSLPFVEELTKLEPCGSGNREPSFLLEQVKITNKRLVGAQKNHFAFSVPCTQVSVGLATGNVIILLARWINCPKPEELMLADGLMEIVFSAQVDEFRGRRSVKLYVHDMVWQSAHKEVLAFADHFIKTGISENAALLPAQMQALESLARRHSTLAVLATGRGKSLIFQIYATWLAMTAHKGTILVFPLRALLGDQLFHLQRLLQPYGLSAAELSGQTPKSE
ncbi:MAG: single-stranded-DNA-specific exonuclease RecJ, partial [Coriobacteriales bacterium]|nr:single-stranded-DNA-specific exonuclease RecJ [Coriobacteriales bacterium]